MLSKLSECQQCATPDFSNLRDELEAFKYKLTSNQGQQKMSDQLIKKRKDGRELKSNTECPLEQ